MRRGIAIAGSAVVDHYKEIDVYPKASTLSSIRKVARETGGLLCNCALDLARIDPALPLPVIGLIGEDDAGRFIRKRLAAHDNIDLSGLQTGESTSFTDVMVDSRHKTRTFFHYRGANSSLDLKHFDFSCLSAKILHIGYLLLLDRLDAEDDDYGTRMARLLSQARACGLQTSIDVVSEDSDRFAHVIRPALPHVDYCLINEYEASRITGIAVRDAKGVLRAEKVAAAAKVLFELGVRRWTVIHAREGAYARDCQGQTHVLTALGVPANRVQNTTGAGDAFAAGVLYGAYCEKTLLDATRLGLAAAASSLLAADATSGVGRAEELLHFYQQTPKESWQFWPGEDA